MAAPLVGGIFRIAGRDETGQQRRGEKHFGSHAHNRTLLRRARLQSENFRRNSRGPGAGAAEDGGDFVKMRRFAHTGDRKKYQSQQMGDFPAYQASNPSRIRPSFRGLP